MSREITRSHEFPRGSNWRRWDFHVHTPASYEHNFGSDWDAYVAELIRAAGTRNIAAIALADYFSIDGYRTLLEKSYYDPAAQILRVGGESAAVLIVPGIELRLSTFTKKDNALNLHVLFDPAVLDAQAIQARFLNRLKLAGAPDGRTLFATREDIVALGRRECTNGELDLFSRHENSPTDEDRFLRAGLSRISIGVESLQGVLHELRAGDPKRSPPYLLALPARGHGSLGEMDWRGRAGLLREEGLRRVEIVMERSRSGIDFHLGRDPETPLPEYLRRFGAPKPSVWGSDAKEVDKLLRPNGESGSDYTWIKANLSFEGLRQITYEPEVRVRIQPDEPEQKPSYLVIDSVRYLGDSRFSEGWIPLNRNLTAIIGGKSAGKSLLLYNIAVTIDRDYVQKRYPSGSPYTRFRDQPNFEVRWLDGVVQQKLAPPAQGRPITYIPQSFINEIAEDGGAHALRDLILRILMEDDDFLRKYEAHRESLHEINSEVKKALETCLALREQLAQDKEQLKALGETGAIQVELDRTESRLDELRQGSGVSVQDEMRHDELRSELAMVSARRELLQRRLDVYAEVKTQLGAPLQALLDEKLKAAFDTAGSRLVAADADGQRLLKHVANEAAGRLQQLLVGIGSMLPDGVAEQAEVGQLRAREESLTQALNSSRARLQNRAQVEEHEKRILSHRQQLQRIEDRSRELHLREARLRSALDNLFALSAEVRRTREQFVADALPSDARRIAEGISLTVEVTHDAKRLTEQLFEALDRRQVFYRQYPCFDEGGSFRYSAADHFGQLRAVFNHFFEERSGARLKSNYRSADVLERLVGDYFDVQFNIIANGDLLESMSPGKRGMVLLQLLLERSNAKHPILLDQPEDNLDNRTIFSELRAALRLKKVDRQIIIVTHDPNLVVAADAEEVVVANQNGQREAADNALFQFEYATGALENSFSAPDAIGVLAQKGIREHVCELLEGGEEAFRSRQRKYCLV